MQDASEETFYTAGEVHGSLEGGDGGCTGEAGAEVDDGRGGEGSACAVGEDEGWGGGFGGRGVGVALDGVLDEVGSYGQGRKVGDWFGVV